MSLERRRSSKPSIEYTAKPLADFPDDWIVEAINYDQGCTYITLFEGKDAGARASEYARFKNEQLGRK